jgi:hypothetical protein
MPCGAGVVISLTLYSRTGCHLCDEMKAIVASAVRTIATPVTVQEIDISTDPELESRYGLEIPVLLVDGKKVAKYRVGEAQLRRILLDKSGGSGGSGE